MRIDRYLAEICPDLSRSYVQKLLKSGDVEADGVKVKPSYRVSAGEVVELEVQAPSEPEILAQDMDLDIVYEDEDVILINKPKGMVVHPAAGHYEGTLVNGLMAHCKDQLSGINGMLRPGIVHRIDKDTTGILIVCKNDMAHRSIAAQLKEHSITRRYQAIVCGVIREEEGTVDAPIGRHPTDTQRSTVNEKNGRHAVTHYRGAAAVCQLYVYRVPAGNRKNPPDPGAYGQPASSDPGGCGVRSGPLSFSSGRADPACRRIGLCTSQNRTVHGIYGSGCRSILNSC